MATLGPLSVDSNVLVWNSAIHWPLNENAISPLLSEVPNKSCFIQPKWPRQRTLNVNPSCFVRLMCKNCTLVAFSFYGRLIRKKSGIFWTVYVDSGHFPFRSLNRK